MIKKWRNRMILFSIICAFLIFIGVFFVSDINAMNERMERLKEEGTRAQAQMIKLDSVTYTQNGSFVWGYMLPVETPNNLKGQPDGTTHKHYSLNEYEEMGQKVDVVYMREGDFIISFDLYYVENFHPMVPVSSYLMFVIAGLSFALVAYYAVRNIIIYYVSKKGEETIGSFEEAEHSMFGSNKYYKVRYTFIRDGQKVTATSPPFYTSKEADNLKNSGTFTVKYIGKRSVIVQKTLLF